MTNRVVHSCNSILFTDINNFLELVLLCFLALQYFISFVSSDETRAESPGNYTTRLFLLFFSSATLREEIWRRRKISRGFTYTFFCTLPAFLYGQGSSGISVVVPAPVLLCVSTL